MKNTNTKVLYDLLNIYIYKIKIYWIKKIIKIYIIKNDNKDILILKNINTMIYGQLIALIILSFSLQSSPVYWIFLIIKN